MSQKPHISVKTTNPYYLLTEIYNGKQVQANDQVKPTIKLLASTSTHSLKHEITIFLEPTCKEGFLQGAILAAAT